jgi:hypothetical protein
VREIELRRALYFEAIVGVGRPREYDITINGKGTDLDTEYTVMPGKPLPLNPLVKTGYEKASIKR